MVLGVGMGGCVCPWDGLPQLVMNTIRQINDKMILDFIPSISSNDRFKLYKDKLRSWA
jgi:hypothetical protein